MQLVHVPFHLGAVLLVVALAGLVVDDQQAAVGAAHDAVGTQVLDAVFGLGVGCGDGAFAIDLVGGVKPGRNAASLVHDGVAHVSIDTGQAAQVVLVVVDGALFQALCNDAFHVVAVADAAQQAVEPDAGIDVRAGDVFAPDAQFGGYVAHGVTRDGNAQRRFLLVPLLLCPLEGGNLGCRGRPPVLKPAVGGAVGQGDGAHRAGALGEASEQRFQVIVVLTVGIGTAKDVHLDAWAGHGHVGLVQVVDGRITHALVDKVAHHATDDALLDELAGHCGVDAHQGRHDVAVRQPSLQGQAAQGVDKHIACDPILVLAVVAVKLPVGKRQHHAVKFQTLGLVDGHHVHRVTVLVTAHRQRVLFLVPVAQEFPHAAAVALRAELRHRVLECQQESRLAVQVVLSIASGGLTLEMGDDGLDDAR